MNAADTDVIVLPFREGTLQDFSLTAANWWVKQLVINDVKYDPRLHASDPYVEAVRNALAEKIMQRILVEEDGPVWLIANFDNEMYPMFEQALREQGLRGARWYSGPIMWLSYRQGIARIEVRKRHRRHPHRPAHNKVIYERLIKHEPLQ